MKKLGLPLFCCLAIYLAVIVSPFHVIAQQADLNLSGWQSFVDSSINPKVRDTFFIQTFNGTPEDNWEYTIIQQAELFDAKAFGIPDASEGKSLKLNPGAVIVFEDTERSPWHIGVNLHVAYATHDLMTGENLHIIIDGDQRRDKLPVKVPYDRYSFHFQDIKEGIEKPSATIRSGGEGFFNFQLQVSDSADQTANGFYALDSVCGWRSIKAYTLFTGSGDWQDTSRWSHAPASRNRHALIRGEVSVSANIQCDSLLLGEGRVCVAGGNHLFVRELVLNGSNVSLSVAGDIHIKDRACYQLALPETGQWYFVSFPFDVYAEGIDPGFQLGDQETEAEGNFFYLKTYDGIQRSTTGRATDNWKTVPATIVNEGDPVFRKGQGYLIALDKEAGRTTLQFAARHDQLPTGFGREGTIPVKVSPAAGGVDPEHQGWILCGNPLPASLPLSAIEANAALDGYVYMYDGQTFQAYPIHRHSEIVIPPLAAFFVKAGQDTELKIQSTGMVTRTGQPAYSPTPFRTIKEPAAFSATANRIPSEADVSIRPVDGGIQVAGLLSPGLLSVIDLTGRVLVKQSLSAGTSFIPLHLSAGVYILQIDRAQYKVVWDN